MVAVNEKLMPGAERQNLPVGNYYLLQDTLYRAVALTDSSGAVVEAYDCDAYGNTLIFTAADSSGNWWGGSATQSNYGANDIIFCGYRYDPETENYYVRNRFYSPTLGRWLTRDPIGYQGGVNLYEYVGGDPAANVDAEGLFFIAGPTWPTGYNPIQQGAAVASAVGSVWRGLTSAIGTGIYSAENAVQSGVAAAEQWAKSAAAQVAAEIVAIRSELLAKVGHLAGPLYKKYCDCKAIREGKYFGVNLGGSLGGFTPEAVGGLAVTGVQAIIICAAKDVSFYFYIGPEVGVGTPGPSASVTVGPTGGSGVYGPNGYSGVFVGGQATGGIRGAVRQGGHYVNPSGTVTNWQGGLGRGTPGISATVGAENYFLIGTVHI